MVLRPSGIGHRLNVSLPGRQQGKARLTMLCVHAVQFLTQCGSILVTRPCEGGIYGCQTGKPRLAARSSGTGIIAVYDPSPAGLYRDRRDAASGSNLVSLERT